MFWYRIDLIVQNCWLNDLGARHMNDVSFHGRTTDRQVLVVGAAGMDMVGIVKETAQPAGSNPANIRVSFGGVARNVGENLARLGQPVHLMTAVGRDYAGDQLLAYTAGCGVQVQACLQTENDHTGSYLAVYAPDGSPMLALDDMSILSRITPAYLRQNKTLAAGADLIFMDANLSPAVMKVLIQLARKARIPICADTTSRLLAERLIPYLDAFYMVTANSGEASVLCQNNPLVTDQATALQAARSLVSRGVVLAVVTMAEFGVVYATSETSGHVPAVHTQVIDPTGGGDALTATIIFGLLNDIPMDESVRLGVTAASLILRHRGTVLPGLSLEKLYDELVV
jgi:pseudouridine kinase